MSLRFYLDIDVLFVSSPLNFDDTILGDVVLVDDLVSPGLPDQHGQLGSLLCQLVVDVDIVLSEVLFADRVLACPHALRDDMPGRALLPAGKSDDVGMVLLLLAHRMTSTTSVL